MIRDGLLLNFVFNNASTDGTTIFSFKLSLTLVVEHDAATSTALGCSCWRVATITRDRLRSLVVQGHCLIMIEG